MPTQSTFTKANGYTPDTFAKLYDLDPSQMQKALRYQQLKVTPESQTSAEEKIELTNLEVELQNYIISPDRWNHFADSLRAMQVFIKTEVEDYVLGKQGEIADSVLTFTSVTVPAAQGEIQVSKDGALAAIEKKKENIIDYMDATTAGKLRNDIGLMPELTTVDKSSLVKALNEVKKGSESVNGRVDGIYAEKGVPNGIAETDNDGKVPVSQLPPLNYVPLAEKSGFKAFLTPGTFNWTCPQGVTEIFVTAVGGGGGGSGQNGGGSANDDMADGSAGEITSFDSLLAVAGGGGAIKATSGKNGGGWAYRNSWSGYPEWYGSWSVFGWNDINIGKNGQGYGAGGNAGEGRAGNGNSYIGRGGGAGETVVMHRLSVTPGLTYSVRVGKGGVGGNNTTTNQTYYPITKPGSGAGGLLYIQY